MGRCHAVDESYAFREHRARWLYTGLTRAARKLTVVDKGARSPGQRRRLAARMHVAAPEISPCDFPLDLRAARASLAPRPFSPSASSLPLPARAVRPAGRSLLGFGTGHFPISRRKDLTRALGLADSVSTVSARTGLIASASTASALIALAGISFSSAAGVGAAGAAIPLPQRLSQSSPATAPRHHQHRRRSRSRRRRGSLSRRLRHPQTQLMTPPANMSATARSHIVDRVGALAPLCAEPRGGLRPLLCCSEKRAAIFSKERCMDVGFIGVGKWVRRSR